MPRKKINTGIPSLKEVLLATMLAISNNDPIRMIFSVE